MSFYSERSMFFGLLMISTAVSQNETVSITFDKLIEFATRQSTSIQIMERTYSLTKTEQNIDLQWANPDFNYSQEFVDTQLEHYLTLNKQIEMPWVYSERQRSWDAQLESAGYKKEEQIRRFISDLKSGYIELKLLGTQLEHLAQLKDAILEVSGVARDQFKEGTLSGVEQHLIQMTLVNINARLQETKRTTQLVRSRWKANMGISVSVDLLLSTDIYFQPVALQTMDHYLSLIPNAPGLQQREMMKLAIRSRIQMERKRFIPHFSLFGGSKRVEGNQGYVAGISIPLPLLNRNRAVIQKQQIELEIADSEFERYRQNLRGQIETLVMTIGSLKAWLENVEIHIDDDQDIIVSLMAAYQEGWMSLMEILNAIQIHADGDQQYYKQLIVYYRNIFQLEAIMGQTLVTFSVALEGDKQ
ncbi:MAG: TolC family protein [Candidatus Marinimicrobia bacterium]|nr:TolC family protein [Candidatus Neomarinimicrobiota bacterium]